MDNQLLINNSVLFIINMPGLLEKFVNMFRSALDEKYKNIMRPLPKLDAEQILKAASFFLYFLEFIFCFQEVGEDVLPVELGGNNGRIEDIKDFWKEEIPKHQTFLSKLTKYKTDESLRPEGPKTSADLFGSCCIM